MPLFWHHTNVFVPSPDIKINETAMIPPSQLQLQPQSQTQPQSTTALSVTSLLMVTSSLALESKENNNGPSDGEVKGMGNDDGASGGSVSGGSGGVSGVVSGYTAAASHFDRLFSHYGGHITVLNLVS